MALQDTTTRKELVHHIENICGIWASTGDAPSHNDIYGWLDKYDEIKRREKFKEFAECCSIPYPVKWMSESHPFPSREYEVTFTGEFDESDDMAKAHGANTTESKRLFLVECCKLTDPDDYVTNSKLLTTVQPYSRPTILSLFKLGYSIKEALTAHKSIVAITIESTLTEKNVIDLYGYMQAIVSIRGGFTKMTK